ncbi:hypothetical protein [Chryseobacterium kwangjuense]|uniref:Lipoprotein n=1 Tax=Chryseobacterium kwangjuense TaxID=267125 RepID=A0A135WG73_9FLAO|nr:hypothetical protein [Chryseobacterium kwangjuense]KXH83742.1 hypothetical protein AU378_22660 [Chryseobacterium kwangjuense]
MRNIFLLIIVVVLFSCIKEQEKIKLPDITNESNYRITSKKENDTVIKINGENDEYTLTGYKDIKNNVKVGWWEVRDIKKDHLYKIEYISLDKNKENQVKFFEKGHLINRFSQYYETLYHNNGYEFKFYFPLYSNEDAKVEFGYITTDGTTPPLRKTIKCKKENDYYICFIPLKDKNQLIAGTVNKFSSKNDKNNSILLSSTSMYVYNR